VPGGRPAVEKGGTFQPTLNEQIGIARANADEQFDNTYIEQFRGQMQNRLNFLQGQLQQAYTALLSSTSGAFVKDSLGTTDNKFLYSSSRGNGYQNYGIAFKNVGKAGPDVDGDGKDEITDGNALGGAGLDVASWLYSDIRDGTQVRARAMTSNGAALDIKEKIGITMRSEEYNDPTLGPMTPGFNYKVKEYETNLSTGAYWSGINYLYAWRPSQLQYTYVDAYGQNSDAAGFAGYLSDGVKTNGGDKGDGSLLQQSNGNAIKWQGAGFGEGYLATYASSGVLSDKYNGPRGDIGITPTLADDDNRFGNTYYARTRTIAVEAADWDLAHFAANGGRGDTFAYDGVVKDTGTDIVNNHDNGVGLFDVINGNATPTLKSDGSTTYLPGSGKIDETFTGAWLGRQHKIDYFNGMAVNGNAVNPIFGNLELARYQAFWDADPSRNDANYLNGVNLNASAVKDQRLGQLRQFRGPTGNLVWEVDPRPQDQNSLADFIMEAMRKPMYRDIFRLGLFKDVVINGGATTPAGGVVNGTLRLSFLMFPDHSQGKVVPGMGYRPGLRSQMIVFQDKFNAKGPG
jgi:hypothetical protein